MRSLPQSLQCQPSRPKRCTFCSFYSRLRAQADLTSQPSRPKRCTFCSFYSKLRTKLGKANRFRQGKHINNTLGFTGRKRFYMPKLAGPSNNLDRRRFRLPDESKLLFDTYLYSFSLNLYTKMIKIISFCYVFIAQPEQNPPQIFCDPEAVHLIADVKNSLKMCCMLRLLPSYYCQNVFTLFTVILHTPFLEIEKISNYSSALLLLQLMYYIYREDINIKTQASGCYINHYGHK